MAFTDDELVLLRKLAPGLSDAVLTRKNPQTGAGYVPDDPQFYQVLDQISTQLGVQPADILVVLASESNFSLGTTDKDIIATPSMVAANGFDPSLTGKNVTPRGLPGFTATMVPIIVSAQEWNELPTMTAAQQLAIVGRMYALAEKRIGRPFKNAFEIYLANANPGSLVASGKYDETTPMYKGAAWETNLVLDHGPSGLNAIGYAMKNGQTSLYYADPVGYARNLVSKGVLKGYVSLGDLKEHASRMTKNPGDPNYEKGWDLAWKLAAYRYTKAMNKSPTMASVATLVTTAAANSASPSTQSQPPAQVVSGLFSPLGDRPLMYVPDLSPPSIWRSAFRSSGLVKSSGMAAISAEQAGSAPSVVKTPGSVGGGGWFTTTTALWLLGIGVVTLVFLHEDE